MERRTFLQGLGATCLYSSMGASTLIASEEVKVHNSSASQFQYKVDQRLYADNRYFHAVRENAMVQSRFGKGIERDLSLELAKGLYAQPKMIHVDHKGRYFVLYETSQELYMYEMKEEKFTLLKRFAPENVGTLAAVATDKTGYIYVSDSSLHCVHCFHSERGYERRFGELGTDKTQFNSPTNLIIDDEDRLHIVDSGNHSVKLFSKEGTYLSSYKHSMIESPLDIAMNNEYIFIADRRNYHVIVADLKGQVVDTLSLKAIQEDHRIIRQLNVDDRNTLRITIA